jgi:diguanylate cyclase (GGDEF)-like protein
VEPGRAPADVGLVRPTRHATASSRRSLGLTLAALALFITGVWGRPDGEGWAVAYDLVLYNLVYVGAALVSAAAARRAQADRMARWAMTLSPVWGLAGNLVYSLVVAPMPERPFPSIADAFFLVHYVPLYVALIGLIRARVVRFHASMWLDGIVGALGAGAVAVSLLLGPALEVTEGHLVAVLTNLAYPVADVVLLALLVGVSAMLGVRRERTLLLVGAAIAANLVGDIVYLDLATAGVYVEGGPLDLAWLSAMALFALAAFSSDPDTVRASAQAGAQAGTRVGWRVLALPLTCNLASLVTLAAGYGDRFSPAAAWLAVGCVVAALARTATTFREVRAFNEVREQARTDELTGLPNRRALMDGARQMLATATARHPAALLLLDLDGFKEVNDSLGHHAGDSLLRQVGPRLHGDLRASETLARLGGDEFAVLLPDVTLDEAQERAARLRELLLQPFTVEGTRLHVGVSIGVATAPVPAATVQELLRCADVAMYAAKSSRDGVHTYVPDPNGGTGDRLHTMEELRTALDEGGQLLVHLQPQVDLGDGRVVGAEALVRWQHPTRGLLSPADLLPAAEQAGLLRPLAEAVLELSLDAAARWWPERHVPVSVNLSAADVTDLDLPADELKLDRSLIQDVGRDPRAAAIVRHTVALAHDLGLTLVAEGVEDAEAGAVLAWLGCDTAQGYVIARPMPVEASVRWLRAPLPVQPL